MSVTRFEPPRRRDPAALIIAAGLAVIAGVMLWDSARLADLGGYSGVGPASVPRVVAFCLLGLSVWTAIEGLRGDFPRPPPSGPGAGLVDRGRAGRATDAVACRGVFHRDRHPVRLYRARPLARPIWP
jgi:hypothetical protein